MKSGVCNLSSCFLCKNCIPEWKQAVVQKKQTFYYKRAERIFSEGENVEGIFFLFSGAVKVHKQWEAGKELILRFSRSGDILGHRGMGASHQYPVSATALVDTEACFIKNDFLDASLKTNLGFTYKLMEFYADELQKTEMRMHSLSAWEAKARIASTLLELDGLFGRNKEGQISVPIVRQDIAFYAGTTYETVFKVLKGFLQEGIIGTSAKNISVLDENKLKAIIENKT